MSYDKSYGKKSSDSYQKVPMNFEKILELHGAAGQGANPKVDGLKN